MIRNITGPKVQQQGVCMGVEYFWHCYDRIMNYDEMLVCVYVCVCVCVCVRVCVCVCVCLIAPVHCL